MLKCNNLPTICFEDYSRPRRKIYSVKSYLASYCGTNPAKYTSNFSGLRKKTKNFTGKARIVGGINIDIVDAPWQVGL